MISVELPYHLLRLARTENPVSLPLHGEVTLGAVIDALEQTYPPLRGTLRPHQSGKRRPLVRFFAAGEDISNQELRAPLPEPIANGSEPLIILGAIAGG